MGQYDKNENGLIQLPSSVEGSGWGGNFGFSVKDGNEKNAYIKGEAMASLIGAVADVHVSDLTGNGFSTSNGGGTCS